MKKSPKILLCNSCCHIPIYVICFWVCLFFPQICFFIGQVLLDQFDLTQAEFYRAAGNKFLKETDYTQAVDAYTTALDHLKKIPNQREAIAKVLCNRSLVFLKLNNRQRAEADAEHAITQDNTFHKVGSAIMIIYLSSPLSLHLTFSIIFQHFCSLMSFIFLFSSSPLSVILCLSSSSLSSSHNFSYFPTLTNVFLILILFLSQSTSRSFLVCRTTYV